MKLILTLSTVAVLVVLIPSTCMALWEISPVTRDNMKELGLEIRTTPAGPESVRVEVEFPLEGKLKGFSRVDLRVGLGDNPTATASLLEDRSKPGQVIVSFSANRADLDKLSLWVMLPTGRGGIIHEIRVKEFVDVKKDR